MMKLWALGVLLWLCPLAQADTLRLVAGNGYAPFSDKSLPQRGLSVELVEAVVKEMGHTAEVSFLPWKRGYSDTQRGEFIGTFPYIRSADREVDFLFSEPLGWVVNRVFVTQDSPLTFNRVEDLIGKTACNSLGSKHPKALENLIDARKIRVEKPRDLSACFKMLQNRRADFVSINEITGWGSVREAFGSEDGFQTIGPPVERVSQHLIIAKSHPQGTHVMAAFNRALAALEKRGVTKEIADRHVRLFLQQKN